MVNFSVKTAIVLSLFATAGETFAEDRIKSLTVQFQTGSATAKRLAIKSLKESKEPFLLPFFIKQLNSNDTIVRALAYEGVSNYPESQVLSIVEGGLTDRSLFLKEHLLSLFSRFTSEKAISLVAPFLKYKDTKDSRVQLITAGVLGHIGHLKTLKFLTPTLNSHDNELRALGIKAILNIIRNNQNQLYMDFDSEYAATRKEAAFKIVSFVLDSTLPFIVDCLQSDRASKKEKEYAAALFALYSEFIPPKLETYSLFEEDTTYLLRAKSIIDRLHAAAMKLMGTLSSQPPQVRSLILRSAWRYRNPAVFQILADGLSDSSFLVRLASIEGLTALNAPGSAEKIIDLIYDKNHYVIIAALKALFSLSRGSDFISSLTPLLSDPDPDIQWHAARILGESRNLSNDVITALFSSPEDRIRAAALRYISLSGDDNATLSLVEKGARDISPLVREQSVLTLAEFQYGVEKNSILTGLLLDPASRVKRRVINEIKNEVDNIAFKYNFGLQKSLVKTLMDADHQMRATGAEILGAIGGEESIKPLKILLTKDNNLRVIKAAMSSLEKISVRIKKGRNK